MVKLYDYTKKNKNKNKATAILEFAYKQELAGAYLSTNAILPVNLCKICI